MEKKKPRRKWLRALVILLILVVLAVKFPLAYALDEYSVWNGEGTHDTGWTELLFAGTVRERLTARAVMAQAEAAFSALPQSREEAEGQFGLLSRYCITGGYGGNPVSETHSLKLIAAHIQGDSGILWVRYSQEGRDAEGKTVCGSRGVNSRWTIQRDPNGEWQVTAIHEHP